ncbi:hypothetical protein QE380_000192 [Acinetobacter baylyi]|uniref:Bacteriophage protein n=1 Tax=Acinetobacter baylyi TaxID=202950 RepID=A0ABU0URV0_ACIBI|nr:hypothetical protein [Acinetobacter baylyi]MDQ1207269.1 hypothetical protein [Acinetobacter baylyi]MDR6105649.1 hypothetical protein [Acinetobacter baylyi]MDR6187630.1 hypothetical protein [Acinetobacter baylyi]
MKVIYTNEIPEKRALGVCYRTEFINVIDSATSVDVDDDFPNAQAIRDAYSHLSGSAYEDITDNSLVPVEQFDAIAEKLAKAEDDLATAKGESIAFQNDLEAMQKRIAELDSVKDNADEQSDRTNDQTETTEKPKRASKPKPEGE